jgi:hypothetical protein
MLSGSYEAEDKELASAVSSAYPSPAGATTGESQPKGGYGQEKVRRDGTESTTGKRGGAMAPDDAATRAARQFMDLATQGKDMLNLDLKILGDPYFIGDSGMGNFTLESAGNGINKEGSIDWQKGQVMVRVTFRTPNDINTDTGMYDFKNSKAVRQFSGIFKVQGISSEFNKGKFTQVLGLVRQPGQDSETPGKYPKKEPMPYDAAIGGA